VEGRGKSEEKEVGCNSCVGVGIELSTSYSLPFSIAESGLDYDAILSGCSDISSLTEDVGRFLMSSFY